jgi:hypothetical protein
MKLFFKRVVNSETTHFLAVDNEQELINIFSEIKQLDAFKVGTLTRHGVECRLAERLGVVGEFVTVYAVIDSAIRYDDAESAMSTLIAAGIDLNQYI